MRDKGWTQTRFAAAVGVAQGTMSRMLSGEYPVGIEVGMAMADLTGIEVERLITDRQARKILESYVERLLSKRGMAKESSDVA